MSCFLKILAKKDFKIGKLFLDEERNSGPLKLVLRLPVPKDTDASLSSDVFPGGESDGILQSDEDDDGSRTFLTNDEVEMIREVCKKNFLILI